MQPKREAKILTVIGLTSMHAVCHITFMLYPISGLLVAHFENIGFYIGSSYSKYRLFTGFSIKKYRLKKRFFQTHIEI